MEQSDQQGSHPNKKVDQNKTNSEQIMGIEKKILITALLLIITIARYKSVIKINTNCSELVRIIEQDAEIKGDPNKYKDPTCKLCRKEVDDQQHWMICPENEVSLKEVTEATLNEVEKKTECQMVMVGTYQKKVYETYIAKKLPLMIITEEVKYPTIRLRDAIQYTPLLHNKLMENIRKQIWLKNRAEIKKKEGATPISNQITKPPVEKKKQS
ncbi:hypothetical protein C2G38_2211238 [Gigaspora rosea]|uniref:Uncharacterized protein n=1 Tax=Gigaspora rosea TaxID=44941 RepID=A0A397UEA9_9GLOM|nr:hypothetical protein C2G38_2211238 [Gigaspora rosea]